MVCFEEVWEEGFMLEDDSHCLEGQGGGETEESGKMLELLSREKGEGEGVLIGKPLYGGFANDLKSRAKAKLLPVSLKGLDVFSKEAVKRYEEALLEAEKEGIKTKVLVLCTPHNPLGQYPPGNPLHPLFPVL